MTTVARLPLTIGELYDQPALMDLRTLSRALGIAESTGYQLAAEDRLPVEIVRLGRRRVARTADVLAFLHLPENSDAAGVVPPTASDEHARKSTAKQTGANS